MQVDDPFGWIMEACNITSSEESRLRCCSYFGQSDSDDSDSDSNSDSGSYSDYKYARDIPTDPVGFTMITPPGPLSDELPIGQTTVLEDQETFHTPPESRSTSTSFVNCDDGLMIGNGLDRAGQTVAVDVDSQDIRAVDLGRDSDLGFSEVEVDLTQRIEADPNQRGTCPRESEENRVSKRGFLLEGQLSTESPSKRLRSLNLESPIVRLGTLMLKENVRPSPGANSKSELENQQNYEFDVGVGEGRVRKRRLDFSNEVSDSVSEERFTMCDNSNVEGTCKGKSFHSLPKNNEYDTEERKKENKNDNVEKCFGRNKNIVEDIHKVRRAGGIGSNSRGMEEKAESKRALPSWGNESVGDDESANEELETDEIELREMEDKTESKQPLPSWANESVGKDETANEGQEVNAAKLLSGTNRKFGDDKRVDEEAEVNEPELTSWANERVEDDKIADVDLNVSGGENVDCGKDSDGYVHFGKDSDGFDEDSKEITLLDVLLQLKEDYEEDKSSICLSLLEIAERKWGAFSSVDSTVGSRRDPLFRDTF